MLRAKLKGGALYIAIIISVLIAILLSMLLLLSHYNVRSVQNQLLQSQLTHSLQSGFEIAKSSFYDASKNNTWQKLPFNNDSVRIKKTAWGCFTLLHVSAKSKHFSSSQTGLFGSFATPDTALLVRESNRSVGLAGTISFKGFCYLPKAGISTAYIEGTSFANLNALRPFIKKAPNNLPELDPDYLKSISEMQSSENNYQDSSLAFIPEQLKQPFQQQTVCVKQFNMTLKHQQLVNHIKLIATDILIVNKETQLNQILLIARKIIFKKGFKGSVHVIAKDSIVIEDECEFDYPSSLAVYDASAKRTENNSIRGIFFGEKCHFKGALLAATNKEQYYKSMIRLNKGMELIGNAYSSDYLDAQGELYGTVMCQSLLLQTASAAYENHLLNASFDSKKYGNFLSVPLWLKSNTKIYTVAKWF